MMRILRTTQALPTETLEFEPFVDMDGQGMPSYDSPIQFEANVVEYDTAMQGRGGRMFVVQKDGSEIRRPLTLYVKGDAEDVPGEQDRITRGDTRFIVAEKLPISGLWYTAAEPDHFRLHLRREGSDA